MRVRPGSCAALAAVLILSTGCGEGPDSVSPAAPQLPSGAPTAASAAAFQTVITFGPQNGGNWLPNVTFKWFSSSATRLRWTLVNREEFVSDTGQPPTAYALLAWADTLQFHPDLAGGYDTSRPAWIETRDFTVRLGPLPEYESGGSRHVHCFAVRAVDGDHVEDLDLSRNFRYFSVRSDFAGPRIILTSENAGVWQAGDPVSPRELFAGDGIRFEWRAAPGQSQTPVRGYSFALDDTTHWAPISGDLLSWPHGDDVWRPTPGPHTFWVKAVDEADLVSVLEARMEVFAGPRACAPADRDVLIVLDTDPLTLVQTGILPPGYETIERTLVDGWFAGYDYRVFETHGTDVPSASDLDCASSVFWFHSTSAGDGDNSVLSALHRVGAGPTTDPQALLPSYVAAGGNFFLCGVQPVEAMRYFRRYRGGPNIQQIPVIFTRTITDTTYVPHWAVTEVGIDRINATISNTFAPSQEQNRLSVATSAVPGEYPDLPFDPLRWPSGPVQGGFGYYDRDVQPLAGSGAEVAYTVNDTGLPLAVRNLHGPGLNGSTFFLGLHPYFLQEPELVSLLQAVLGDFGEAPVGPRPRADLAGGNR